MEGVTQSEVKSMRDSYNNPQSLTLIKCKNSQEFLFDQDNTIRLKNYTNLCLTVAKKPSRKGRGGSPVHLMRNLSMQKCNIQSFIYQTWGIRHFIILFISIYINLNKNTIFFTRK